MGCIFQYLKYIITGYVIYKLAKIVTNIIYPFFFAVPQNLLVLAGSRWALVTGSTDGIGKAYAFELAKKGFNLILISRTQSKLDEVANEISQKYSKIEIQTIAFDFSNANLDDYKTKIFEKIKNTEVGLLVNNVGLSYEFPERFDAVKGGLQRLTDVAVINTVPTTILSAFVLKEMVKRRSGVVINISSSAAYFHFFYWAVYSATKKYVNWLSDILRDEYAPYGITIQTVCPMMVATKMSKIRKYSFFVPSPEKFAADAVRSIGHIAETTGCAAHQIQSEIMSMIPNCLMNKFITRQSLQMRSRALKKEEREAAAKQE